MVEQTAVPTEKIWFKGKVGEVSINISFDKDAKLKQNLTDCVQLITELGQQVAAYLKKV